MTNWVLTNQSKSKKWNNFLDNSNKNVKMWSIKIYFGNLKKYLHLDFSGYTRPRKPQKSQFYIHCSTYSFFQIHQSKSCCSCSRLGYLGWWHWLLAHQKFLGIILGRLWICQTEARYLWSKLCVCCPELFCQWYSWWGYCNHHCSSQCCLWSDSLVWNFFWNLYSTNFQ